MPHDERSPSGQSSSLSPNIPISQELAQLDTVLQSCSSKQLEDLTARLREDIIRLSTAKKTLMSENYEKFINVHEHLQKLRNNLIQTVDSMKALQESIQKELNHESLPTDEPVLENKD